MSATATRASSQETEQYVRDLLESVVLEDGLAAAIEHGRASRAHSWGQPGHVASDHRAVAHRERFGRLKREVDPFETEAPDVFFTPDELPRSWIWSKSVLANCSRTTNAMATAAAPAEGRRDTWGSTAPTRSTKSSLANSPTNSKYTCSTRSATLVASTVRTARRRQLPMLLRAVRSLRRVRRQLRRRARLLTRPQPDRRPMLEGRTNRRSMPRPVRMALGLLEGRRPAICVPRRSSPALPEAQVVSCFTTASARSALTASRPCSAAHPRRG